MDVIKVAFWKNGREHLLRLTEMRGVLSEGVVWRHAKRRRITLTWKKNEQMVLYRRAGFMSVKQEIWPGSDELRKVVVREAGKVVCSEQEKRDVLLLSWVLTKVEVIPERRVLRVYYRALSSRYELTAELDMGDETYYLELKRLEYSQRRDLQCELRAVSKADYRRFRRRYIVISPERGGWWLRVEPRRMYLVL